VEGAWPRGVRKERQKQREDPGRKGMLGGADMGKTVPEVKGGSRSQKVAKREHLVRGGLKGDPQKERFFAE